MSIDFRGRKIRRLVLKIGSSLLIKDGVLNRSLIASLVDQVFRLKEKKVDVLLVSSGAVGYGLQLLGKNDRNVSLPQMQAAAAIGQSRLMGVYDRVFARKGMLTAQVLLTREDFQKRLRYLNTSNTLSSLLKYDVVPVINENDTVAVDEICWGDNDTLGALVTSLIDADLFVILTDMEGLYDFEKNCRIESVTKINSKIVDLIRPEKTLLGKGGMLTKIEAARIVVQAGKGMVIASGHTSNVLSRLLAGEDIGTYFIPCLQKMSSRKRWLAFAGRSKGQIVVDQGAYNALAQQGKSMLASGIQSFSGKFEIGDVVDILYTKRVVAKGLTNFSSLDVSKIKGLKTLQIKKLLKVQTYNEVIHRNNLVLMDRSLV